MKPRANLYNDYAAWFLLEELAEVVLAIRVLELALSIRGEPDSAVSLDQQAWAEYAIDRYIDQFITSKSVGEHEYRMHEARAMLDRCREKKATVLNEPD